MTIDIMAATALWLSFSEAGVFQQLLNFTKLCINILYIVSVGNLSKNDKESKIT